MMAIVVIIIGLYLVWIGNYLLLKTVDEDKQYWRIFFLVVLLLSIGGGAVIGRTYWMIANREMFSEMIWSFFPVQRYYFSSNDIIYHWLSALPWVWWQFDQGVDYFMTIVGALGFFYVLYIRAFSKQIIIPKQHIMIPRLYSWSHMLVMVPLVVIISSGMILFPIEYKKVLLLAVWVSLLIRFSFPKYAFIPIFLIIFIHWQNGLVYLWLTDLVLISFFIVSGIYWRKFFDPLIKMMQKMSSNKKENKIE